MKKTRQSGFSMIELIMVVAITLIIAAIATPTFFGAIANIRMRATVSQVAGMAQQTRMEAVRANRFLIARTENVSGARIMYIDKPPLGNMSGTPNRRHDPNEPVIQALETVNFDFTGANPVFPATLLNYTPVPSTAPVRIAFNARGLPCTPTPVGSDPPSGCDSFNGGNPVSYLYFFSAPSTFRPGWAALTITPAGRIRVWMYDGRNWN